MNDRDDFPQGTKKAVALRAAYRCSMPGRHRLTVGPSEESSASVAIIGEATHIHAASPGQGARRYLASMSAEERTCIMNAT